MTKKNRLWAPWRMAYIQGPKTKGCFLCRIIKEKKDAKNFVLLRTRKAIALLNTYPYNNGHVMVVPTAHVKHLEQLKTEEITQSFAQTKKIIRALKKAVKPCGFNIGINLGKAAGAGLESHIHIHIVPRWDGDTNFMPTLAGTKVISQSLKTTYKAIKKQL
ncbi:HIT domain-containing protein [Candidatus Omnitrophota bacterium]